MSDFVRIPPDSTGKQIRHKRKLDINVTITNSTQFSHLKTGDIIVSGSKSALYTV